MLTPNHLPKRPRFRLFEGDTLAPANGQAQGSGGSRGSEVSAKFPLSGAHATMPTWVSATAPSGAQPGVLGSVADGPGPPGPRSFAGTGRAARRPGPAPAAPRCPAPRPQRRPGEVRALRAGVLLPPLPFRQRHGPGRTTSNAGGRKPRARSRGRRALRGHPQACAGRQRPATQTPRPGPPALRPRRLPETRAPSASPPPRFPAGPAPGVASGTTIPGKREPPEAPPGRGQEEAREGASTGRAAGRGPY